MVVLHFGLGYMNGTGCLMYPFLYYFFDIKGVLVKFCDYSVDLIGVVCVFQINPQGVLFAPYRRYNMLYITYITYVIYITDIRQIKAIKKDCGYTPVVLLCLVVLTCFAFLNQLIKCRSAYS